VCVKRNKFSVFLKKTGTRLEHMDIYGAYRGAKRLYDGYKQSRGKYRRVSKQYAQIGRYYGGMGRARTRRARRYFRKQNYQWGGMLGVEKKYFDTHLANQTFSNQADWSAAGNVLDPAGVSCLNAPVQGTTALTRVGLRYNIVELHLAGAVQWPSEGNQNSADNAPIICWALVMDKQPNGATITANLVYQNPGNVGGTVTAPLRNLQYAKRFKVMKQWTCTLLPTVLSYDGTNMEQGGNVETFEYFKQWKKPIRVETVGNAGTIADNVNCAFHVIGLSTNPACTMSYNARIRFTDP